MFQLISKYTPTGDQPKAIKELLANIDAGVKEQTLLGATGTGKTFTIANIIEAIQKPTLVIAPNKTLAGQLYAEFKELFPNNYVCYFVSYYDYFQPEAYVPKKDMYIEKVAGINDEIDELRHYATSALVKSKDVIVIASVSCIYGIGEIEEYENKMLTLELNEKIERNVVITKLIEMLYERNEFDFKRGTFRVKGDILEIIPASEHKKGIRISFFDNEIEKISEFDVTAGAITQNKNMITIFPASHFVTSENTLKQAIENIKQELEEQLKKLNEENKVVEYQRLKQRVNYDIEMLSETGFCNGVENYARHLALKQPGAVPTTLVDFFKKDFLLVIDESHVTIPQIKGMYNGDQARKSVLVDYGFRLPSAKDNRPLKFEEFKEKIDKVIYVSATPSEYEIEASNNAVVEQIIRPTGLIDPIIEVRKTKNQIDDLVGEISKRIENNERSLITTLTIKMAEELSNYLKNIGIKTMYLHSEIKTLERLNIIRNLRLGKIDVIVGINLLREGLDIPEVSLIAIMDADKQGFLRSERSLIQTIGRAARNINGKVIMYADKTSQAMSFAIAETERRRKIQLKYNLDNNIVPKTITKEIKESISTRENTKDNLNPKESLIMKENIRKEMEKAAESLDFERAIELRNILFEMSLK